MYTNQAITAGLPAEKVVVFHSSVSKITVNIPVLILEYFRMGESCTMVVEPAVGIELETMKSVIVDSNRVMDPFGIGLKYSEILSYKDDVFKDERKLVVEFSR